MGDLTLVYKKKTLYYYETLYKTYVQELKIFVNKKIFHSDMQNVVFGLITCLCNCIIDCPSELASYIKRIHQCSSSTR